MLKHNINFKKGIGWSVAMLVLLGLFSYLTFVPSQTFAETLIIDPNEHRSLKDISTMQEMSQQICINSRENESKQLLDARPDISGKMQTKTYWVAKLKDGNCWMTQNLDYDDPNSIRFFSTSEWSSSDESFRAYYDPGNHYYNGPDGSHAYNDGCFSIVDLSECVGTDINKGLATEGDSHYHIGNYYSWDAAMNGTGVVDGEPITGGVASGSICPREWMLPVMYESDSSPSFGQLRVLYKINANSISQLYSVPIYFVYRGILANSKFEGVGSNGGYWSSAPTTSSNMAYRFYAFRASLIDPNLPTGRYYGASVRCVAKGGGFPDPILADNEANVSITVSSVISIDVTQHVDTDVDFTRVAKSSIIARVGSNQPYQVLFSTNQSALEQSPSVNNQNIPMITQDQTIEKGISKWGIKKLSSPTDATTTPDTIYSPVGIGENKALFYTSNTATSEDLTFPVAIAVSPQLPQGTYSTQVTLTAVAI